MSEENNRSQIPPAPHGGPQVIARFVKMLPSGPGVYRMLDAKGEVLYVGKARNLKKRVSSYAKSGGHTNRIAKMISLTASMEFVTTRSETEALLLEANLIKKFRPRYNVLLRDDKSFPYILVRRDHDVPQILKHRGARSIKGDYYGPFASAGSVTRTLNVLQRGFLLRTCSDSTYESRTRPCLLFQIKRCSAPCTGEISVQGYNELVDQAEDFLKGKDRKIHDAMTRRMEEAAEALDFETAAVYRDRVKALSHIHLAQGINPNTVSEADVIAAYTEGAATCVEVFFFRSGQNWGNRAYFPRHDKAHSTAEVLSAFISQFYDNKPLPKQIILSEAIEDMDLMAEAFTLRAEHKIEILVPQRGEKRSLVEHAIANAKEALERRMAESATQRQLLEGVADLFDMEAPPERIEIYDNSHIQGTNALGGMVVAGPDGFIKNQYRKFNIKDPNVAPGDDYAMMREVLTRRFSRLLKEAASSDSDERPANWPDLVLIDGGAGQLSVTEEVFKDLGVENVTLVSIAKGPDRDAGLEKFHMPGRAPFMIDPKSPVLYYLQRLRDEAHRFAIGSHRARRKKSMGTSPLDEIPGIGGRRKRALLNHFGSARAVSNAALTDLEAVEGISKSMAERIYGHFRANT
ncbi:MAG: excinuclease ABC subunit UvrC [Alphaproteobacteria bacterium]|nr:MAG: excinuclease ABC subunit UvrC [Alphaproteobacteria bacterium]